MTTQTAIKAELVQAFVGNSHGDLDKVRELLAQEPAVVNASWDWGRGDWETGLGAAAHMGRADIAGFLVSNGARLDIFAAAMLGLSEVVASVLEVYPAMAKSLGPHGSAGRSREGRRAGSGGSGCLIGAAPGGRTCRQPLRG